MHLIIAEPEMMANFMHQHMRDQMFQRLATFRPFIEDGPAEQMDGCRQITCLRGLADGAARIEAGQLKGVFNAHFRQRRCIGEIVHDQRDMAQMRSDMERMRHDMQRDQMKITAQAQIAEGGNETTIKKTMMDNQTKTAINEADNMVAMTIASAEIESGEKTALTNGNGFDPGN